jgi:hypothetical protein
MLPTTCQGNAHFLSLFLLEKPIEITFTAGFNHLRKIGSCFILTDGVATGQQILPAFFPLL